MNFLINVATSGKYTGSNELGLSDYLIRYVLMNFIIITGIIVLSVFAVLNFINGTYFNSFVCAGMLLADLTAFMLARTKIRQIIPSLIIAVFYILLCVMVTWTGQANGANFLFIYMFPSVAIMLLGMRYGVALSVLLIALISIEMFVPSLVSFNYQFDFSIRMLISYFLVLSVMAVIETTRKTKDRIVEVQRKVLEKQAEKLRTLSATDALTKLNNRRSFLDYIDIIWKQSFRLHLPITVLMIDIDCFKKYNDSMGHLAGDKTLVNIAQCIKNHLKRETDFAARFGGEEFVCLLPYIEKAEAMDFVNELVRGVENMKIPHPTSEYSKYVTISAGMASIFPNEHNSYTQLLDKADRALYMAKQAGKNRVVAG
ncbi:MAG: GGDEF domain-containing protein [Fibromonadaceae bacterium]|jgi:diguanylate cyclase (GGDEF)-like protein|nr:GGDEF domain-containing protein [Fibromonadaceae bacterium]